MRPVVFFVLALTAFFFACNSGSEHTESTMIPLVKKQVRQEDFKIFSEPASDRITIVFRSPVSGNGMLDVYTADGKYFEKRQLIVAAGLNTWDCYYDFKTSGTYFVKFRVGIIVRSGKFFKTFA